MIVFLIVFLIVFGSLFDSLFDSPFVSLFDSLFDNLFSLKAPLVLIKKTSKKCQQRIHSLLKVPGLHGEEKSFSLFPHCFSRNEAN